MRKLFLIFIFVFLNQILVQTAEPQIWKSAIGMEVGSIRSLASLYTDSKPTIIEGSEMPSIIMITDGADGADVETRVGKTASDSISSLSHVNNVIYDVANFIGRQFSDVKQYINFWTFELLNERNNIMVSITQDKKTIQKSPTELQSNLMAELRSISEKKTGETVTSTVIVVPMNYDNSQRQATLDAAKMAGFTTTRLLNKCCAAVIAYGNSLEKSTPDQNVLAINTEQFTTSVHSVNNLVSIVKSQNGLSTFSYIDMINQATTFIQEKSDWGINFTNQQPEMLALRLQVQKAFIEFQTEDSYVIEITTSDEVKNSYTFTQIQFMELFKSEIEGIRKSVTKTLKQAKLTQSQIKKVILVGQIAKITSVLEMINTMITGNKIFSSIDSEEIAVEGAAILASSIAGNPELKDIECTDMLIASLGIESFGRRFTPIIKNGTIVPINESRIFTTNVNNQGSLRINVFQGENQMAEQNKLIGRYTINNILAAKKHTPRIQFTLQVNPNGIVDVSVKDLINNVQQMVLVKNEEGSIVQQSKLKKSANKKQKKLRRQNKQLKATKSNKLAKTKAKKKIAAVKKVYQESVTKPVQSVTNKAVVIKGANIEAEAKMDSLKQIANTDNLVKPKPSTESVVKNESKESAPAPATTPTPATTPAPATKAFLLIEANIVKKAAEQKELKNIEELINLQRRKK